MDSRLNKCLYTKILSVLLIFALLFDTAMIIYGFREDNPILTIFCIIAFWYGVKLMVKVIKEAKEPNDEKE